ncbi:hypothetical protein HRG84_00070 [Flavisolibacter sp. BT320]|nr:hypothetical protein [Flavisolibacter longurius]
MNKIFGIALAALVLASCQNSGGSKKVTPVAPEPATLNAPALPAPGAQPAGSEPTATAPVSAPAPTTNGATAALNPEHGAPGHRCDIPVGTPLNSAPANAAAPAANPAPIQMQTPPPMLPPPTLTQPVNSNARLNPAHGQPGHDCSIPVGQPLKS